jgi:Glu-tRNA(Gln) amidotransferase subunit E-like FAD-binding protein
MEQQNKINTMQEELMKELGLNNLSEDQQRNLLTKMTETVLKRIFLETLERLDGEDKNKYQEMIEKNSDPEKVNEFLREKIDNYYRIA